MQVSKSKLFCIAFLLLFVVKGYARKSSTYVGGRSNIVSIHVGLGGIGGYVNVGAGVEYERFTRDGYFSFVLPFDVYHGGTLTMGEINFLDEPRTKLSGYYVAPGLKVHPMGNDHHVDLGIGFSMALGSDKRRDYRLVNYTTTQRYEAKEMLCVAQVLASANLQTTNHFVIGFFLTGGYMLSHTKSTVPVSLSDKDWLLQIGFKMGGRF